MPPSTIPSTSSAISSPGRRFGSSDQRRWRNGAAQPTRHDDSPRPCISARTPQLDSTLRGADVETRRRLLTPMPACFSPSAELLLDPLDGGSEDVAAAAHRLDHRRLLRVVLDLAPKPANLDIDRPVDRPGVPIAGAIEP